MFLIPGLILFTGTQILRWQMTEVAEVLYLSSDTQDVPPPAEAGEIPLC